MVKPLEAVVKHWRGIATAVSAVVILSSTPVAYYGAKQKNNEYRVLHTIEDILRESGNDSDMNVALFMSMVKKESSFYGSVIGRDNEAGLLQLKPEVAQERGLKTSKKNLKASSKVSKLFYIDQRHFDDDRLIPEKNLRAGTSYVLDLTNMFQSAYKMDRKTAIDFALISYNLGPTNVKKLFRLGYSKNPRQFIGRLSKERLNHLGITNRKRAIVVDYYTRMNLFRMDYNRRVPQMRRNGSPTTIEYAGSFFRSFPEIYTRLGY